MASASRSTRVTKSFFPLDLNIGILKVLKIAVDQISGFLDSLQSDF